MKIGNNTLPTIKKRFMSRRATPKGGMSGSNPNKGKGKEKQTVVAPFKDKCMIPIAAVFDLDNLDESSYYLVVNSVSECFSGNLGRALPKTVEITSGEVKDSVFFVRYIFDDNEVDGLISKKTANLLAVKVGEYLVVLEESSKFDAAAAFLEKKHGLDRQNFLFYDMKDKYMKDKYSLDVVDFNVVSVREVMKDLFKISSDNLADYQHALIFQSIWGFSILPAVFPEWKNYFAAKLESTNSVFLTDRLFGLWKSWNQPVYAPNELKFMSKAPGFKGFHTLSDASSSGVSVRRSAPTAEVAATPLKPYGAMDTTGALSLPGPSAAAAGISFAPTAEAFPTALRPTVPGLRLPAAIPPNARRRPNLPGSGALARFISKLGSGAIARFFRK